MNETQLKTKVVMLGTTGVGKTTFMSALYGVMQNDVEGFRLKITDSQEHRRWLDLAKAIPKGQYPFPTDQRDNYEFYLTYQGSPVLQFDWADYRGGALRESQTNEQAKLLQEDLRSADGIMLFCDSHALVQRDIRSTQLGTIIGHISRALSEAERSIALTVVLTKADQVQQFSPEDLLPFEGLIGAIGASDSILGCLIPVACGPTCINVPLPLLFTLNLSVYFQYLALNQEYEDYDRKLIDEIKKTKGFVGLCEAIGSRAIGKPGPKQRVAEMTVLMQRKRVELEAIFRPTKALLHILNKLPLIDAKLNLADYARRLSEIKRGTITSVIDIRDIFDL